MKRKPMKRLTALIIAALMVCPAAGCRTNPPEEAKGANVAAEVKKNARVSYLGPEGTYTEEAAQYFFGDAATFVPKDTVNDAITELTAGRADFAVIPQENTLGGAVTNYVDALIGEKSVYVVGEVILPIS